MKIRHKPDLLLLSLTLYLSISILLHGAETLADSGSPSSTILKDSPVAAAPPAGRETVIRLVGTAVVLNGEMSLAVIQYQNSNEQIYCREGEWINKDFRVKKILYDRMIIDVGGSEITLTMSNDYRLGNLQTHRQIAVATPIATPVPTDLPSTLAATSYTRKDFDLYFSDINALQTVHVTPIEQADTPDGFVIRRLRRYSILWRMGFQNGDVIKRINGKPVSSPLDAESFFKTLKAGGNILIDIEREGRAQVLEIEVPAAYSAAAHGTGA